jgi:hypothetical protein
MATIIYGEALATTETFNPQPGRRGPGLDPPDIIITHETHSKGMFVPWIVDPHYSVRVRIDGRVHFVGEFDSWDEAYEAGEKYIKEAEFDALYAAMISDMAAQTLARLQTALDAKELQKGGLR